MNQQQKIGTADPNAININEPFEVRGWADKFGVTNVRLKAAVNTVGTSAKKVEAYLKRQR